MDADTFQVRHGQRTERAIVAQSELRRTRLDVSGGQIARTGHVSIYQDMVVARLFANDHKVGQWVKALILKERRWQAEARLPGDQCTSRSRDGVRHLCCDPLYYCTATRGQQT